jgi:hypothetical protein
MRAISIVIAVFSIAAASPRTARLHPRRSFSSCHRNLHVAAGRSGNPYLETDIAVKRMRCATALRAIERLPTAVLSGSRVRGHAGGFACLVRGSGQPSTTDCTRGARAYRFDSYSD